MTAAEVLAQLKALGNEDVHRRNEKLGAGPNQFGVMMGDIRAVAKKLKTNHTLGMELWETDNIEARLVALLIIKPKQLTTNELDAMARSIDFMWVADWFNSYILKDHPQREALREEWMDSDNKWVARSGWSLTAGRIARDAEGLDIEAILNRIETEMPAAPPEAQWTMNTALAHIGIHHPAYRQRAIDLGERLGILRDYPVSKGCTSPFAPIWIKEMVGRQAR